MAPRSLSPHIKERIVLLQKTTYERELQNLQNLLTISEVKLNRYEEKLAELQATMDTLEINRSDAQEIIAGTKNDIRELESILDELQVPSDRLVDPHTGLCLPIKRVCGEHKIDETTFVGLELEETDTSTRWIPLSDICKHVDAKKLYDSWKTLQTQYKEAIPDGIELSTEQEFTKAITEGWQPTVVSENLLPIFQMHDNAPKVPFTEFVNYVERGDDLHAVVMTRDNQRVIIPLRAIASCALAKKMWNKWLNMRYDCDDLGIPFKQDENYTYRTMQGLQEKLAASPLRTPADSPVRTPTNKRKRKN